VTYFGHLFICRLEPVNGREFGGSGGVLCIPSACRIKMIVGAIFRLRSRTEREGCERRMRRMRLSFAKVKAGIVRLALHRWCIELPDIQVFRMRAWLGVVVEGRNKRGLRRRYGDGMEYTSCKRSLNPA
jgi:hypothetical protein